MSGLSAFIFSSALDRCVNMIKTFMIGLFFGGIFSMVISIFVFAESSGKYISTTKHQILKVENESTYASIFKDKFSFIYITDHELNKFSGCLNDVTLFSLEEGEISPYMEIKTYLISNEWSFLSAYKHQHLIHINQNQIKMIYSNTKIEK